MNTRTEAWVTDAITRWLRTVPDLYWVKIHGGGPYQRAGLPDLFIVKDGRAFAIEVKRPTGGRLSPGQRRELEKLAAAGATVGVARSLEEAQAILAMPSIPRSS